MEQLNFKLESFEGPLDLLLILIKKNKVNIYDIPISVILDQYLEVMRNMQEMDLEISSEFLVLAATLLQIKSKMLLPKPIEEGEENQDPREELIQRLVTYKKIKEASELLKERQNIGASMFFKAPDAIERPPAEWNYAALTPENIRLAYQRAYTNMQRRQPPSKHSFEGIVGHEKVSIRQKVIGIWGRLKKRGKILFLDLFHNIKTKPEAVASFLAVLELIKMKKITVDYANTNDIHNPKILPLDTELSENEFEAIEN